MQAKQCARVFLWCTITALLFAVGFVWYALHHPECGTPFGLSLAGTWTLYGLYLAVTAALFVLWAVFHKKAKHLEFSFQLSDSAGKRKFFPIWNKSSIHRIKNLLQ